MQDNAINLSQVKTSTPWLALLEGDEDIEDTIIEDELVASPEDLIISHIIVVMLDLETSKLDKNSSICCTRIG